MSKFSFLVYHRDYTAFLEGVRSHGLVHLIGRDDDLSDSERERYALLKQIQGMVRDLTARGADKAGATSDNIPPAGTTSDNIPLAGATSDNIHPAGATSDNTSSIVALSAGLSSSDVSGGRSRFAEVTSLLERKEHLQRIVAQTQKEIHQVKPWGDFSVETLKALADSGIVVRFFTAPVRKFDPRWSETHPIAVLAHVGGLVYFVLADTGEGIEGLDADEMRRPERSSGMLMLQQQELEKEAAAIEATLDHHALHSVEAIKRYGYEVMDDAAWESAVGSATSETSEKVKLLEGWVPDERKEGLIQYLEEQNTLYVVSRPAKEEKVPILLKNNKFSKDFESLGELYSMPVYKELDMTPFFAPFYLIFFGFCLGDAGYGVMMAVASLLLKRRVRKELRSTMNLVFYLGLSTIVFGILGGTLFGIPLYETSLPVYSTIAANLAAQGTNINDLLFYLALMLGGLQILFGMVLKSVNEIRQFGWRFAISTFGWLLLLTGGVAIAIVNRVNGVAMEHLNVYLYALLGVSGVMILFLNTPGKSLVMNVGIGIWNTYNMATGILGDLLSYIRLFALGIASAIMGFVFNSLAVEMSGSIPVLSAIIMVFILVVGHSINLFMAGLGAFVHPLRLTFVEFYKNAGYTGGGKKYHPFRKLS